MQIETLKNTTAAEIKPHLRVAAISHERSAFSFLYIGADTRCIKSLSATFSTGLISEDLQNAEAVLREEAFSGKKLTSSLLTFLTRKRPCGLSRLSCASRAR